MKVNSTQVLHFTLTAYIDIGIFRYFCFVILLCLYVFIICANVSLIVVICSNRSLHQPMFMFLLSLFGSELVGSTGLFPFLLIQVLSDIHTVSFPLCFIQIYALYIYGSLQMFTLSIMSYDRYSAICHPLQYQTWMSPSKVAGIIAFVWIYSGIIVIVLVSLSMSVQVCGNIIHKVYCDSHAVLKLACSDTTAINTFELVYIFTVIFSLVLLILYSYIQILKVCFSGSAQTRQKAVSTCMPHLLSLLNFGLGTFFEIFQSRFDMSRAPNLLRIFLSLYWLMCSSLFNPLLYGLKMSKIREALKSLAFVKRGMDDC